MSSKSDEVKYSISPGFSIVKDSSNESGPQSIRRTQRASSAVASIHRSTVTKSFGRKSKSGWDADDPSKTMEQQVRVSSSRPARMSALLNSTIYVGGDDEDDDTKHFMCIPLTNNVKALFIMMVLFAVISLAQYFAAIAANSQSLKADVVSMAVDALSYLGNILGESSDIPAQRVVLQLVFSAVSIVLLLYFNTQILKESIEIMEDHKAGGDEDGEEDAGVEGSIVIAFAFLGLLFDAICLYAYYHYAKLDAEEEFKLMKEAAVANGVGEELGEDAKIKKPQVNMLTALLHVSADLLRSTCTFIEGIVLLAGGLTASGQEFVDAICGIIIGASLYAASAYALYEWVVEFTGWFAALGAPIEVYIPEIGANIVIKPDKAGHSKAADAFLG